MSLPNGYGYDPGEDDDVYKAKSRRRASEYYEPPASGSGSVRGWWQKLRERRDTEAAAASEDAAAAAAAKGKALQQAEEAGAEEAVVSEEEEEEEEEKEKEDGKKPLAQTDLQMIFQGAPYFFLEKGDYGQWFPLVIYPYSETDSSVQSLWDRRPLSHGSFSLCTLHAHIPVPDGWVVDGDEPGRLGRMGGTRGREPSRRAAFDVGIFEVPNMLDANGKVAGTVGVQYFLEMPIGDTVRYANAHNTQRASSILPCEEDTTEPYAMCARGIDRRTLLEKGADAWKSIGVRDVSVADLTGRLERLRKVRSNVLYNDVHQTILDIESPRTLHDTLFCRLLHFPPVSILDDENPLSIKCQIRLLTTVLATEGAWIDFSLEEWRLRAGRILWETPPEDVSQDVPLHAEDVSQSQDASQDVPSKNGTPQEIERTWLLIQMLLAGELLLRVDGLVHAGLQSSHIGASATEIGEFDRLRDRKVNWDLISVRRLFDSMRIEQDAGRCVLVPLRVQPQLHGLLVFAEQIGWPNLSVLKEMATGKVTTEDDFRRPLPASHQPDIPTTATRRILSLHTEPGTDSTAGPGGGGPGWITRSWLSGFIMPGDSINQLLLCSVLENDPQAQRVLGEQANVRGGFSYQGQSWWSKHCIIGKVVAGLTGSQTHESMGWLRSDLIPHETASTQPLDNRWFEVRVKEPPAGLAWTKPRIKHANQVARQSTPLGTGYIAREAFSLPIDQPACSARVDLVDGDELTVVSCSRGANDQQHQAHLNNVHLVQQPALSFRITPCHATDAKKVSWPLTYNVQFIAGYDCRPPRGRLAGTAPGDTGHPENKNRDKNKNEGEDEDQDQDPPGHNPRRVPGHPLHSTYAYRRVGVSELLREDSGSSSMVGNSKVLVVNARGSATKATFARAWCASMGRHAVIARVGRTCVACSIREARAMNVDVVIREDSVPGRGGRGQRERPLDSI